MKWSGLAEVDARYSGRMRLKSSHKGWWQLAIFFAHSGDSWFWLVGLILVWLFGGPEWRIRAAFMAGSLVALAVFVLAIKFTVRRRRPEGEWGAIYRSTDPHSFPSGHAARAVLLAVIAWALGPPWFAWLMLIWAPAVSVARVMMGVHYISDVVAGMLVGFVVAVLMLPLQPLIMALFPFLF